MQLRRVLPAIFLLFASLCFAQADATPGTFLGVIIEPPGDAKKESVIFLRGRNGMVRAVEIASAKVEWAEELPSAERVGTPREALRPGSEVRVTAQQSSDGQWHAQHIEVTIRAHIPEVSRGNPKLAILPRQKRR